MVNNTVHAVYAETYDINTAVGELSLLGIHTPQASALKKMFKGFFEQYKKYKILGCNLKMVCASQQSLDPSQMGLEAGQVDPRDVLNPILFKACTGENMNALVNQIYGGRNEINDSMQDSIEQHVDTSNDALTSYYELLADTDWRKSHPQGGLEVSHLVPMVHKIVSTRPFAYPQAILNDHYVDDETDPIKQIGPWTAQGSNSVQVGNENFLVSNGVTEMPWLDTVQPDYRHFAFDPQQVLRHGAYLITDVPRVYMGCIILPPAILQRLFFRMTIVWHVAFKDFRPAYEVGPVSSGYPDSADARDDETGISPQYDHYRTYFNLYHNPTPSKVITKELSSFTTNESVEAEQIGTLGK